jgi:hypothetical protein
MTLFQTTRPHYRTILTGTFYLAILQSSTLMAASSEFAKSEDPIPAAVSVAVFGEATLPTMGQSAAVPSAPAEEPNVRAGAATGSGISSDVESVLSDHPSDDEAFRELIAEARSVSLHWDKAVKQTIRGKRIQKKLDIAAAKQAEVDARRAVFLAKLGEPLGTKEVPAGAASSAAAGSASAASAIVPTPPVVAAIATDHEAFYRRFLEGRLEYRPTEGSDAGLVVLPFRDILDPIAGSANPLSATFDLSRCGDAGKHLSINIGYKKAKAAANADKTEIWICPKFLAESEAPASLTPIMGEWEAPLGYFCTWGGWEVTDYWYLTKGIAMDNDKNLYKKLDYAQAYVHNFYAYHFVYDFNGIYCNNFHVIAAADPAAAIVPIPQAVPAIATGHEAFYRRLLAGRLEYRPTEGSDAGLVVLPIGDLLRPIAGSANPLSATFDLSRCGDAWKYLSINIGYKKAINPANKDKTEIWICPKFLAERELDTFKIGGGIFSKAKHPFAKIMDGWEAPVGYFWTWGGYDVKSDNYDYLLKGIVMENDKNLYEKWWDRFKSDYCNSNPLTRYANRNFLLYII